MSRIRRACGESVRGRAACSSRQAARTSRPLFDDLAEQVKTRPLRLSQVSWINHAVRVVRHRIAAHYKEASMSKKESPFELPAGQPRIVIMAQDDLIVPLHADRQTTLSDVLDPPIADELLKVMRCVFAATYRSVHHLPHLEEVIMSMRDQLTGALLTLGHMLDTLGLTPLGELAQEMTVPYQLVFVDHQKLLQTVAASNREELRGQEFSGMAADELLRAAWQIHRITRSVLYTREEFFSALSRIRQLAAEALVPCNLCLETISVEPVAMPTVFDFKGLA
jgi:hypothetical protein